jgi:hypothetical protein
MFGRREGLRPSSFTAARRHRCALSPGAALRASSREGLTTACSDERARWQAASSAVPPNHAWNRLPRVLLLTRVKNEKMKNGARVWGCVPRDGFCYVEKCSPLWIVDGRFTVIWARFGLGGEGKGSSGLRCLL